MNTLENTELLSKKSALTSVCCDTVITHDVSEEFVLPDYVNEVRRVLFTKAQALPESKYIADTQGGVSLELGGVVTYFIIYTDDEGKLCSTPLSSNYEAQTILKSRPSEVFVDTSVDNVTTRVSAPRRLTIKCRLRSRIMGYEENEVNESILQKSSADELYIERLPVTVNSFSSSLGSSHSIKISEKFDTVSHSSLRPVICDASISLRDVKASRGTVSCHGEASIKCLCESEDGLIPVVKNVPIYEEIDVEGVNAQDSARAEARCVSLSISSEESDNGAGLFFDLACEIECESMRNLECVLTKDCYSTKCEMDTCYRDIELFKLIKNANSTFSINESVKRKSKESLEIVDTIIDPVYEKCDFKSSHACFMGRACVGVIARNTENGEFLCESYEIPFKYECELDSSVQNPTVRVSFGASVNNAKYSDDKFNLSAELYPSILVLEKSSEQILDTATLKKDTEFKNDASCVRVFFPKDGDILWEIAKRYHTSGAEIIEQNSLDSESLDGVKSIII